LQHHRCVRRSGAGIRAQCVRHPDLSKISIILVFLVMAVVLIVRPWGLFGSRRRRRGDAGLSVNPGDR